MTGTIGLYSASGIPVYGEKDDNFDWFGELGRWLV